MADLTITASAIIPAAGNTAYTPGIAGATITAGDVVYLNTSDSQWYLAKCDGTAAEAGSGGIAIAISGADTDQPFSMLKQGSLAFGSIITATDIYVVSNTAGNIMPIADLSTSSWYMTVIGHGISTTNMQLDINSIGATSIQVA